MESWRFALLFFFVPQRMHAAVVTAAVLRYREPATPNAMNATRHHVRKATIVGIRRQMAMDVGLGEMISTAARTVFVQTRLRYLRMSSPIHIPRGSNLR